MTHAFALLILSLASFLCGIGFALLAGWLLDPATSFGPLHREADALAHARRLADVLRDREVELKGNPFLPIERPESPAWRGPTAPAPVSWRWMLSRRRALHRRFDLGGGVKPLRRKDIAA